MSILGQVVSNTLRKLHDLGIYLPTASKPENSLAILSAVDKMRVLCISVQSFDFSNAVLRIRWQWPFVSEEGK